MALVDLFKPKWKHSDVTVRMNAVRSLDPSETTTLAQIARNDSDEGVRRLAIRRLEDPDVLAELAGDLDGPLADLAHERASGYLVNVLLEAQDADAAIETLARISDESALAEVARRTRFVEVRRAAFERLSNPKSLADVARQAKDEEVSLAAVAAIDDVATLRSLALGGASRQVALAALDRIDDPPSLEAVTKQAKTKSVRIRARRKLDELQGPAPGAADDGSSDRELERHRRAQLVLLCQEVEKLSPTSGDPAVAAKLEELTQRFSKLTGESSEDHSDLWTRFGDACKAFATELEAYEQRLADVKRAKVEIERDAKARSAVCERVEALPDDGDEAALQTLETEWAALGPAPAEHGAELEARMKKAIDRFRRRHAAWLARRDARTEFEQLVAKAEAARESTSLDAVRQEMQPLRRRWHALVREFGVDTDLQARWDAVHETLKERETGDKAARKAEREENEKRLAGFVQGLVELKDGTDWRAMSRRIKEVREALRSPGPVPSKQAFNDLRDRFRGLEKDLHRKIEELREAEGWNRHFADARLEELCVRAEALGQVVEPAEIAAQLRALQGEWKKIGHGTFEKKDELWARFKKACDEAFARCEGFFISVKQEREGNLEKKQAICVEAEELAESEDWKGAADRLKQLQADWKAIGPVDRKHSDAVWKRFRAACDRFFDRRKEHFTQLDGEREENLRIKEGLCERAEAMADSSQWQETADSLKDLQNEWRGIGPVPKKHSDAVWKRFRAACDRFFARRDAHLDDGRRANLSRKQGLCDELEELSLWTVDEDSRRNLADRLLEIWREWPSIEPIPFDEVEALNTRLEKICSKIMTDCSAELADTELAPATTMQSRERIVAQMEKLFAAKAPAGKGPDTEGSGEEDVAQRLQRAMENNTFRQEAISQEKLRIEETAEKLLRSWRAIPPTPGDAVRELARRFEQLYHDVTGRAPDEEPRDGRRPPGGGRGRGKGQGRRGDRRADPRAEDAPAPAPEPTDPNTAPDVPGDESPGG
jgi:hypothetical protein